jgi:UPF0755 protein
MNIDTDYVPIHQDEPPRRRLPPVLAVLAGVAVLAAMLLGARLLADSLNSSSSDAIDAGTAVEFVVAPGDSAEVIGETLEEQGVVSAAEFERRVRERQVASELKIGTFALVTGMDVDAVIDLIVVGPESGPPSVTVVEGLTVTETLDSLSEATGVATAEFSAALLDGSVTSPLLQSTPRELTDWEGLLFPDTYRIDEGDSAADILQLLADTMEERVASVDWSVLEDQGFTRYEGIIVASLIEEEVKVDEERPIVASVIYNRLEADWMLQIDATVQYALPERRPALTFADLEVDSPYNTYLNAGLPPTPIAGVRLASLEAAARPDDSDYFFYVLATEDGRHAFAVTAEEFEAFKAQAKADGILPP